MTDAPLLPDDNPPSIPSERTMRGRTAPRGERLRAGDVLLGRYTVLSELGEGGMGVVYRCFDSVGGIAVALKCLPPELSRNEGEMEGIRENYAIVAKLHHSAISGLRQLEKDPDFGEYYLVMDLAEGEDLSAILRRRRGSPMPLPEALAILRPLASALDYAHARRVIHRDVKPGNVKVQPAAEPGGAPLVQLLDFGLAAEVRSSLSRVTHKGHPGSSGTPAYMAPEQWEARPQGPAADQYALAVVAYQMLSGYLPFDADDPDLLRRAVLSREPDPVDGLSEAVNAALLRALAKAPMERFPSCGAFVAALAGQGGASRPGEPQRIDLGGGVSLEMVPCPGVASDFWMGAFEVTQEQWQRVVGTTPSYFGGKPKNPVESVSWNDCQEFIEKLNALPAAKASGLTFRLPTEAEWETACRAGAPKSEDYCLMKGGEQIKASTLSKVAWFGKSWRDGPVAVGSFQPNVWGLYDMHGNVWEWMDTAVVANRVSRGGSWNDSARNCEASLRCRASPSYRGSDIGFRLCASGRAATKQASRKQAGTASEGERAARSAAASRSERDGAGGASRPGEPKTAGERYVATVAGLSVPLRWCPAGSFAMGSPTGEAGRYDDETQHRVTLSKGFWLGETEVTQGLWKKVMGGNNPSYFKSGDDYPVETVSWNDCQEFLRTLNALAPVAGFEWRLPTEAQWEYACRAGTTTAYFWGNALNGDKANCDGNYPCGTTAKGPYKQKTTKVGSYAANPWGLYDMHGNVYEWCADWHGSYPSGPVTDPPGPSSGSNRVYRGGSWNGNARGCRSADRNFNDPGIRYYYLGFRVALVPVR